MSSKSPFSLSRQGTLRSSHSRKNSGHTLTLNTGGRRSPNQQLISPSGGRRSPVFLMYDGNRTPLDLLEHRKSPTTIFPGGNKSPTGHRSPLNFGMEFDRRSPTSTVHVQDQKSPTAVLLGFDERRSPVNFPQGLNTLHVPPITVSNPSENLGITDKMFDMSPTIDIAEMLIPATKQSPKEEQISEPPCEPRKGLVRELLAFVRKPSKKATTRTGKFAAAFSRAESNSATPLLRQSTFSSAPRASSGAAKSAVTKQISTEAGLESKMSFKILNSKMSFRLRRTVEKVKDKKSSGDEVSDLENDVKASQFELEKIRFEKVGESYIKHEKIREETEDSTPSPVNIDLNAGSSEPNQTQKPDICVKTDSGVGNADECMEFYKKIEPPHENFLISEQNTSVDSIKEDGIEINSNLSQTNFTVDTLKTALDHFVLKPEPIFAKSVALSADISNERVDKSELQCPTFEIMPPSRRSSFDPPRSPYLENLRSSCDTDPETMNVNRFDRLDSDSFEMIDTDRNHESSFESRYPSSSHTSFDISRYQSTSCEDQTSSFEIIESKIDNDERMRKSSNELVDASAFHKSSGRKSSLETHFDFEQPTPRLSSATRTKKQGSESNKPQIPNLSLKNHYSASRSLLLNQNSSNYSSRDSHDSYSSTKWHQQYNNSNTSPQRSPFADPTKQHFPIFSQAATLNEFKQRFICVDQRCSAIFEPRPCTNYSTSYLSSHLTSSSEFEPPSPEVIRRAQSASPKHSFTFRIVLKKLTVRLMRCAHHQNADVAKIAFVVEIVAKSDSGKLEKVFKNSISKLIE